MSDIVEKKDMKFADNPDCYKQPGRIVKIAPRT